MDEKILKKIEQACDEVCKDPKHGEVVIKIKNGYVYRWLKTNDNLVLDKTKEV